MKKFNGLPVKEFVMNVLDIDETNMRIEMKNDGNEIWFNYMPDYMHSAQHVNKFLVAVFKIKKHET